MDIFSKTTYFGCPFWDLEKLIKEKLGFEYEIPSMEERGNDVSIDFNVSKTTVGRDTKDVIEMMNGGRIKNFMLSDILQYMCDEDIIEEGNYLIDVSW